MEDKKIIDMSKGFGTFRLNSMLNVDLGFPKQDLDNKVNIIAAMMFKMVKY